MPSWANAHTISIAYALVLRGTPHAILVGMSNTNATVTPITFQFDGLRGTGPRAEQARLATARLTGCGHAPEQDCSVCGLHCPRCGRSTERLYDVDGDVVVEKGAEGDLCFACASAYAESSRAGEFSVSLAKGCYRVPCLEGTVAVWITHHDASSKVFELASGQFVEVFVKSGWVSGSWVSDRTLPAGERPRGTRVRFDRTAPPLRNPSAQMFGGAREG